MREPRVAVRGGHAHARPAIGRRDVTARDQRREQRLAGFGRRRAGEPQGLRGRERLGAVALIAVLHAVAGKLGVLAAGQRIVEREPAPVAALAERLQPFDAQTIAERPVGERREERLHVLGRGAVEARRKLPVANVALEQMPGKRGGDRIEATQVAALERCLRGDEVGVSLRVSGAGERKRGRDERRRQEAMCNGSCGFHRRRLSQRGCAHFNRSVARSRQTAQAAARRRNTRGISAFAVLSSGRSQHASVAKADC